MFSIGFHEYGHIVAMRWVGLRTKGFYFLPLAGGVSITTDAYQSYKDWAIVAIMGPVFGLALAIVVAAFYYITGWHLLAAASGWMCLINAFNLVPVYPLDGGLLLRTIVSSVKKDLWYPVLLVLGVLAVAASIYTRNMFCGFVSGLGIFMLYQEYKQRRDHFRSLRRMKAMDIVATVGGYALVFSLLLMLFAKMYVVPHSGAWENFH